MTETIIVQLYPPTPVGIRIMPVGPQGAIPVSEPCYQYENVKDVDADYANHCISFTNRNGDRIESCLPWIVKRSYTDTGNTDA